MAKITQMKNNKAVTDANPSLIISTDNNLNSYSFIPAKKPTVLQKHPNAPATTTYHYVREEMYKTSIITSFIVAASIILYALIQFRAINVSIFGY